MERAALCTRTLQNLVPLGSIQDHNLLCLKSRMYNENIQNAINEDLCLKS